MSAFPTTNRPLAAIAAITSIIGTALSSFPCRTEAAGHELFIESAVENPDGTATLPLHRGTSQGQTVWYIVLDSSDGNDAANRGVNRSAKLNNARDSMAVQKVTIRNGVIDFPATVDFTPEREVVAGPLGFPPEVAKPSAHGNPGYSPLIQLPNGIILNAPQIANDSGKADKVRNLDTQAGKVTYLETNGFQGGNPVKYLSTDASDPTAAALEDVTFAPSLNAAPFAGGDGTNSARASLAAFVNGQTGVDNPNRQGLNSAILDGEDPLNVLSWNPNQGRYSPLWDVHLAAWSADQLASNLNDRQTNFDDIRNLAQDLLVTGPNGGAFGPAGFIVDCPIVSRDGN